MAIFKRFSKALVPLIIAVISVLQLNCGILFEAPGTLSGPAGRLSDLDQASTPISFNRLQYFYSGKFNASSKGQPIYSINLLQTQRGYIFLGDLKIKGKITPSIAGNAIPTKMRIALRHKNRQNALLHSKNFDFNVNADGVVLLQTFQHRDPILFQEKDVFEVSLVTVDKPFPPGLVNLTLSYVPPPAS
jgi:hypothetical protein